MGRWVFWSVELVVLGWGVGVCVCGLSFLLLPLQ